MSRRARVIGVVGGGTVGPDTEQIARELGALIAQRGWVLLNGGRNAGVMDASARGAKEAGGLVIGVLPSSDADRASEHLTVAVCTGLGDARNVINVLSSDVIIACPGELGTLSEIALALKSGKRVILVGFQLADPPFQPFVQSGQLTFVTSRQEAVEHAARVLAAGPLAR